MSETDERRKLIERIIATKAFNGKTASARRGFLLFLWEHRDRKLYGHEIAVKHYRAEPQFAREQAGTPRQACMDLRREFTKYFASHPEERIRCDLPLSEKSDPGFQLEFTRVKNDDPATVLFWQPHIDAISKVVVIVGTHLFFYDEETDGAIRFYDFNEHGSAAELLEKFKAAHPNAYKPGLMPLKNFFLSTGETHSFELIQKWFLDRSGVLVRRVASQEVSAAEFLRSSIILLGRPATNDYVKELLASPEAEHLAYRFYSNRGAVQISEPNEIERRALTRFGMTVEGTVEPTPERKTVFGIVTRMRNPSGYGHVTIISAGYYAKIMVQIVEALTNDQLAKELLAETGWRVDEGMPDSFEMLFAVKVSPGNLEGVGKAELIASRAY